MTSLSKVSAIGSCYLGPTLSEEQFIPEHFFLYLAKGTISGYDGNEKYTMTEGESCIVRKNHLARYSKQQNMGTFEKIVVVFEEAFLRAFMDRHPAKAAAKRVQGAFIPVKKDEMIHAFIGSLLQYYNAERQIDDAFSDVKREELMLILLRHQPELAAVFFDFGVPQKIDIEAFMNSNYKFNAGIERFAYLTGRSLSAFKRDFQKIFNDTPGRWLQQRRLKEAYYLLKEKRMRPAEVYMEVGFEDLSHFSYTFKKKFGMAPSLLR